MGFLDRIGSQLKFKFRPVPNFNPILQYSIIPKSFIQILNRLGNKNLYGSGLSLLGLGQKFIVNPIFILGILALPFNLIFYFAEYK
jgi:hypothetical protein